jgi:hypothetical protein
MYFLPFCTCCGCICDFTITARGGSVGPRLEFTFGNGGVINKCLANTSLTANGLIPGGLPDGNKLPSPFSDPSIAVWTCVDRQYQIYTNLGTCFLTIYMEIVNFNNCDNPDEWDFEITGWENESGCPYAASVVSISVYYDC